MTAANDSSADRVHKLFDNFVDEAIWQGFTLNQIQSCIESRAADFFRDYEGQEEGSIIESLPR